MNDLLGGVSLDSEYSGLRKQMERIIEAKQRRQLQKGKPKYIVERELRKQQYNETVADVSEWEDIVKKNREADHISFPLQAPPKISITTNSITASFVPRTDLEKEIMDIVNVSNISENKIMEAESQIDNTLAEQDIINREIELQKLRHLMFHKERKLRRQKKIKSRRYRAIRRKQKEKEKLSLAELDELDPDAAIELREKLKLQAYKERMTLRHKRFGKWAQAAVRNPGAKKSELQEHFERGILLRKKINEVDSQEEDFSSMSSSSDEVVPTKGVMGMKFMQRALSKEKEDIAQLKKDMLDDEVQYQKKLKQNSKKSRIKNGESVSDSSEDEIQKKNQVQAVTQRWAANHFP